MINFVEYYLLNKKKMSFFIDFQYGRENFLCKEITILNNETSSISYRFFNFLLPKNYYSIIITKHTENLSRNMDI